MSKTAIISAGSIADEILQDRKAEVEKQPGIVPAFQVKVPLPNKLSAIFRHMRLCGRIQIRSRTRFDQVALRVWIAAWVCTLWTTLCCSQSIVTELDPGEVPGERPYEMVWAGRNEMFAPAARFDRVEQWLLETQGGAQAELRLSRAQNLWGRAVGRLRYQGDGKSNALPVITLTARLPVPVPAHADCVELWVYGNRWGWENPPDTPPVELVLKLRGAGQQPYTLSLGQVRWKEWWLLHQRLPESFQGPLVVEGLEIRGGTQTQPRELYLDALYLCHEELPPLKFAPRPARNLTLFPGQSSGANQGPGRLEFPTREETILPAQLGGPATNFLTGSAAEGFVFHYRGADAAIDYLIQPAEGLNGVRVALNHTAPWQPLAGAGLLFPEGGLPPRLLESHREPSSVVATFDNGTTLRFQIWNKSLVVDVMNSTGRAQALDLGLCAAGQGAYAFPVPYLTFAWHEPKILVAQAGGQPWFASAFLDWYRSNGSELYGVGGNETNRTRINGGVRYRLCTDGQRNGMFERLFVTVSPRFEEVLPVVPNPVGLQATQAVDRLWQESWGPENYGQQMERSRMLRARGIEKLIQCNHEITWRDGGESFTLRRKAAPKRGGDAALKRYVAHQKGLGWLAGLYSNYTDFSPVNEFWSPDFVLRQPDGNWKPAWPRCYALKPLRAVEMDATLAPYLKANFQSTSAYTDVHTAVAPWDYNDYDARCPGAGTFAQTFYAYGELLRNDSRVYNGPVFSEGTYHWMYAGLADGNYALVYNWRSLANEPLLPAFDLLQIHPKECDIGMGWTEQYCGGMPQWKAPENLDRSIDRFLLATLAYGHIGWLVEEEHGWSRTARSYFMLQPVQARYGLQAPTQMRYWSGTELVDTSRAVAQRLPWDRRQMRVDYPGGLALWVNDHPAEAWPVADGTNHWTLPPAGWAARTEDGALTTFSGLEGSNRVDYLRCPDFVYWDGRGQWLNVAEGASRGSQAVLPNGDNGLKILRFTAEGEVVVRRPFGTQGPVASCQAWDAQNKPLPEPKFKDNGTETRLESPPGAVRYELRFAPRLSAK